MALVLLMPLVGYVGLDRNLGLPLQVFNADEYRSIVTVHAASVATLTAFIGLLFASLLSEGASTR